MQSAAADRDRFVSFAFAAADMLVELNAQYDISYTAGSLLALTGQDPQRVIGRRFVDLVVASDRVLVERMFEQLKSAPRIGPVQITFAGKTVPVAMRGIRAIDDGKVRLTFAQLSPGLFAFDEPTDGATGLLAPDSFEKLVNRHMGQSRASGDASELTLVKLIGLSDEADDSSREDVMLHVGGLLRSLSLDGRSAGRLADGRFGFVHRRGAASEIESQIRDVVRQRGGSEVEVAASHVDICEPVLSESEACKALSHVLRTFAGKVDGEESFASLGDALRDSYDATAKRIAKFRHTVENLRFQLHFQPIVGLKDRRLSHFEALSRFRGVDSPFEMINFAEDVGITRDFDLAVVRKVLEALDSTDRNKPRPKIAINLSTRSLDQDSFVDDLLTLLSGCGALAKTIAFEVTESAEIKNLERMATVLERLRSKGHRVALDDFGAGAAAFHYIRALKVDYVKVDGAYIQKVLTCSRDASIVKAMTEMCKSLGVGTIAEMIEDEEQASSLLAMGVDCGQGYLFGRPTPSLHYTPPDKSKLAA